LTSFKPPSVAQITPILYVIPEESTMNLNEKIYAYRKQLNLSQEALADKLNVSRQAVSKWESGQAKPDIDNLIVMAQLFSVTLDELITDKAPQAADIALHLTVQKRQFLRIGVITVMTFLVIGILTVSLLLQQLAEVRQLAQNQQSSYQGSIASLQSQISQLLYSIDQRLIAESDLITDYERSVTDVNLKDKTMTYTLRFLVKDETNLESIVFTQVATDNALMTEAQSVGLGVYTATLILDLNEAEYAVSARFNYTNGQKNQSFGRFSGYTILHPTFNVNFGATASEAMMSIDSIWIHVDSLACYNDRAVLDIPLQLVGKDENGKIVLTQALDLHQQSDGENVCENYTTSGNGFSATSLFLEFPNAKTTLKPDHTYTFEINSPQTGNEELVFPIGTFEYRDGNFISTGNIN
jgi:transcriptional regulator with XRE-family HTH domain